MTRNRPALTVEGFYAIHNQDGRAILREKRGDAIVWIIRTKVMGEWKYALCTEDSEPKLILGYIDLSVITARLPRFRPTAGKDFVRRYKYFGTSLTVV
jgi:hypothetical protein